MKVTFEQPILPGRFLIFVAAAVATLAIAVAAVALTRSGDVTAPFDPSADPAVADSSVFGDAQIIATALGAASGEPLPADTGPFPRDFVGIVNAAVDRCYKFDEYPPVALREVGELRQAVSKVCGELLGTSGIQAPSASFEGDRPQRAKLESDLALQAQVREKAKAWTHKIRPKLSPAESALQRALK